MFFYIFLPLESSHSALHRRCTWKSCRNSLCTRRSTARWSPLSEIFGWEVLVQLNLLLQIIGDGIYIYIHTILYIYYVIMYYICMYIYMIIYIIHTYVPTHLPTYVRKSDVYIYIYITHTYTNYINTYIHIIHIKIYIYTDTLYNLSG